jgi:hypothetical protein
MREYELRYLTSEVASQIAAVVDKYAAASGKEKPSDMYDRVIDKLPIEKMNADTVRRRVEGLYYTSELLFKRLLAGGKMNRNDIVRAAELKPLSHYHYMTGSRESRNNVLTRDDYLNDPSTALVKLKDDIVGLGVLLNKNIH